MSTLTASLSLPTARPSGLGFRSVTEVPEEPGFLETVGAAINSEWSLSWAGRYLGERASYDPTFDVTEPKVWRALTDGIPEEYRYEFARADSMEHALSIRDGLRSVVRSRETLARAGVGGVAATLGAAILDPVSLAAGFGVGGIVGRSGLAAGRVGRFVTGGLAATATEVPIEAAFTAVDPTRGAGDIVLAALGSFTLGGLGEYVSEAMVDRAVRRDIRSATRAHAMGAAGGEDLRPRSLEDLASLDPNVSPDEAVRRGIENLGLDAQTTQAILDDPEALARVADEINNPSPPDNPDVVRGWDPSRAGDEPIAFSRLRRTILGVTGDERVPESARALANMAYGDFLRKRNGGVSTMGADEAQMILERAMRSRLGREVQPLWGKWKLEARRAGLDAKYEEFSEAVIRTIETGKPAVAGPGAEVVQTAATKVRGWLDDYLRRMHESGLIDLDTYADLSANAANYFPRSIDANRFRRILVALESQLGPAEARSAVRRNLAEAMARGSDADMAAYRFGERVYAVLGKSWKAWMARLDEQARAKAVADRMTDAGFSHPEVVRVSSLVADLDHFADEIVAPFLSHWHAARLYMQTVEQIGNLADADSFRIFAGRQLEALRRALGRGEFDVDNLTDPEIDRIVNYVSEATSNPERGVPSNLRARTLLDPYTVSDIELPDGSRFQVKPADYIDRSVFRVLDRYNRAISGSIVMDKVYKAWSKRIGREEPIRTRQGLMAAYAEQLDKGGLDHRADFGRAAYLRMEAGVREIQRVPQPLSAWSSEIHPWLRNIRKITSVVRNGGFAFAALPETTRILAYAGVRNTIDALPALREWHKAARAGRLSTEAFDFADLLAFMNEHEFSTLWASIDPDDMRPLSGAGRTLERAERASFFASGFFHVDRWSKRLSTIATINKFVQDSARNRPWNAAMLRSWGLTPEEGARIVSAIKAELAKPDGAVQTHGGLFGRKMARFNLNQFEDQVAADRLIEAISRSTSRTIQETTTGGKLLVQHEPWGQLMLQFQGFVIASWEKQFLHTIQNAGSLAGQAGDPRAFLAFLYTSIAGSLVYLTQTHLNAIGRGDKEEYLGERGASLDALDIQRTLMAGLQRGGSLSILPQVIDLGASLAGFDAPFDARASGLTYGSDLPLLEANPTFAWLGDMQRAIGGVGSAAFSGDDFSRQDLEAWYRLILPQNHQGMRQLLNSISSRLPDESSN